MSILPKNRGLIMRRIMIDKGFRVETGKGKMNSRDKGVGKICWEGEDWKRWRWPKNHIEGISRCLGVLWIVYSGDRGLKDWFS